jgi:hypothetical protein
MMLFSNTVTPTPGIGPTETSNYGSTDGGVQDVITQAATIKTVIENFVAGPTPTLLKSVFINAETAIVSMNTRALTMQKTMGGVVFNTQALTSRLMEAYKGVIEIGGTFDDVADGVDGLADSMGRMTYPSAEVLQNMVEVSKATGIATSEVGKMVGELTRFGGTQTQTLEKMSLLGKEARMAGLSSNKFLTEINKNMKTVSGFGFKSGVDGMAKMVKQAMLLRTNVEAIGAKKLKDTALDPEGAIQMAADFQMLGGAVGKLSDPFQLMHMAQTDMEGLQNELVNSAKAAMTFNESTGKFDVSTQDMYRLRKQAELTGANLEDLVNTGREAAKLDYIKDKFDLTGLDEKQQGLIASLGTIGAGGSLTVDIPGLGAPIVASNPEELKAALNTEEALEALKEYEANQGLDDRKLAVAQLSVAEQQKIAVDRIKDAVILSLDPEQQKTFYKNIETSAAYLSAEGVKVAESVAPTTATGVMKTSGEIKTQAESFDMTPASTTMAKLSEIYDDVKIVNDAFLPGGGSSPVVMSEGQLYKGIVGDNVAIGTGLDKAFNQSSKLNEIMASTSSTNNTGGGNTSVDGKIDININLTGAISGDKSGDIEKMFSDPRIQKQLMDTVLYKLDNYKRQQGVLS